MPRLSSNNPITADGEYDFAVLPGKQYLLAIKGTWGGATVTLYNNAGPDGAFVEADDGVFTESGQTDALVIPPTNTIRLAVTGATDPSLQVTYIVTNQA